MNATQHTLCLQVSSNNNHSYTIPEYQKIQQNHRLLCHNRVSHPSSLLTVLQPEICLEPLRVTKIILETEGENNPTGSPNRSPRLTGNTTGRSSGSPHN